MFFDTPITDIEDLYSMTCKRAHYFIGCNSDLCSPIVITLGFKLVTLFNINCTNMYLSGYTALSVNEQTK